MDNKPVCLEGYLQSPNQPRNCFEVLVGMIAVLRLIKRELEALLRTELGVAMDFPVDFYEQVKQFEIDLIQTALRNTAGHQQRAARLLGIQASTLNMKMKRYDIHIPLVRRSLGLKIAAAEKPAGSLAHCCTDERG